MSSVTSSSRPSKNRSTLQKLVDAAGEKKHGCTWNHVLQYLKAHAQVSEDAADEELPFDSPLQHYYVANDKLHSELQIADDTSGSCILKTAVATGAPSKIIAALCHLGSHALQKEDLHGRLLLHTVCRYPDVSDKVLTILVKAHPAALLYRDNKGRTPLHYLLWYHCDKRSVSMVDLFCQNLTNNKIAKQVFQNQVSQGKPLPKLYENKLHASVIPDAIFGSLPIHYAVMHGAKKNILQVLLQHLPVSKHAMDRQGHTPLHWYMGAGLPVHEDHIVHVTGEETKLDDSLSPEPYYQRELDGEIVALLLSSRVARTVDRFERTILHCLCKLLAHKLLHGIQIDDVDIIHRLLGAFAGQLTARDIHGKTPAVLFLDTVYHIQKRRWENKSNRDNIQFDPPMELVHILLSKDPKVTKMEDSNGRLPIHAALAVGAPARVVSLLIEQHPTSLMHVDENLEVPLHAAFCCQWSASLQTREIVDLVLSKKYERQGTVVDGRLAMKMEDSDGYYPIHYACTNDAPLEVIECMVERYARSAMLQTPVGDLPVHCLLLDKEPVIEAAVECKSLESLSVIRQKLQVLLRPLLSAPERLQVADSRRGMLPLHIAVLFEAADYTVLLRMLELYPEGGMHFTSNLFLENRNKTPLTCSPLDLHEICRKRDRSSLEDWHRLRELLFSFSPTLESHRHREELLDRCVRIVITELDESTRDQSFHWNASNEKDEHPPDIEITHTVSAMEAEMMGRSSMGIKRRSRRNPVSKPISPNRSRHNPHARTRMRQNVSGSSSSEVSETISKRVARLAAGSSSIYDDEDTGFNSYETGDHDDMTSYTDTAGDGEDTHVSGTDGTYTEDDYTSATGTSGTGTFGDETRTIDYTTSDSRLPTTFEDGSFGSSDEIDSSDNETGTFEESTIGDSTTGLSRQGYSYEISTAGKSNHDPPSFDESDDESEGIVFDRLKQKASGEEKKDEEQDLNDSLLTPRFSNNRKKAIDSFKRPAYMSEVGMRLWTFFVLYCDPNNPSDHYAKQVAEIMDEVAYSTIERLVSHPLPPYAEKLVVLENEVKGLRFVDVASPKCRELILKTRYFLGCYEFVSGEDILVNRSEDDTTLIVKAREWLFTTEEATNAVNPGISEENIWATGEIPAEVNVTFRSKHRPVWIKFTKSSTEYRNEVESRNVLGMTEGNDTNKSPVSGIAHILRHFNSFAAEKKTDRIYKLHTSNKRFNKLKLFGSRADEGEKNVILDKYPYAIVYHEPTQGTLYDFFLRNGVESAETVSIAQQIGNALQNLHERGTSIQRRYTFTNVVLPGLCYGDVSMKNIVPLKQSDGTAGNLWGLFDLSCAVPIEGGMMGEIDQEGRAKFRSDSLPPEMFTSVSPTGLRAYEDHWESVQKQSNIHLDPGSIGPVIDSNTGAICVIKCHYSATPIKDQAPLPYDIMKADPSIDIWGLGHLLFELLTGKNLFPVAIRQRRLQDYSFVCSFDAPSMVYEHVSDPAAQDLLIKCLSPYDDRKNLSMSDVLQHPFLTDPSTLADSVKADHIAKTAIHSRKKKLLFRNNYEKDILDQMTVNVACWDFDVLERFHQCPTEVVRSISSKKTPGVVPCCLALVPFELSGAKRNPQIAERLGRELLLLSKVCFFSSVLKQTTSNEESNLRPWPESEIKRVLDLSNPEFGSIQSQMADLAAQHVEAFRNDPTSIATRLVKKKLQDVFAVFDNKDFTIYFVDEYLGEALKDSPISVPTEWRDRILHSGILFFYLSSLFVRGTAGGIIGLAKLLELDAVPETWKFAAKGLQHKLDVDFFAKEVRTLEEAMGALFETQHSIGNYDLNTLNDFVQDVGPKKALSGLLRVIVCGELCMWVNKESIKQLNQNQTSFIDALEKYRTMK